MSEEATYTWIDRYLKGELTPEEMDDFEQRLRSDKEFADQVATQTQAHYVARGSARDELRKELKERFRQTHAESVQPKPSTRPLYLFLLGAAAAIAILMLWVFTSQPPEQALFAQHFELPAPPSSRGEPTDTLWNSAISAYDQGAYERAAAAFDAVASDPFGPKKPAASLFAGISYLMTDNGTEALNRFRKIDPGSSYYQDALWYEALVYVKLGDQAMAQQALRKILEQARHYKKKEAREILDQLNEGSG